MTATISNKSVFELAQLKGYIPTDYTLNENGFHGYLSEDQYYLEMCFIQKWLREKGIYIQVMALNYEKIYHSWRIQFESVSDGIPYNSYESALLNGINEALKLI